MKKSIFFFVTLVTMIFTATVLTSCDGDEDDLGVVVNAESGIGANGIVSDKVEELLLASKKRMDDRLDKIHRRTFTMEAPKGELPTDETLQKYYTELANDTELKKEIEYLRTIKKENGDPAVAYVAFHFNCSGIELTPYMIKLL